MSMAIAHFAFGAVMTSLLVMVVPSIRYPKTVILFGGCWAMVPDLHWVSPVASAEIRHFHQTSPWTDLFWLHRTWDRIDPANSELVAAGLIALLILVTVIAERRDYRAPATIEDAYGARHDGESRE